MSDIKLINNDCNKALDLLANSSIDLVLTSPPYDELRTYGKDFTGFTDFKQIALKLSSKLKEGGVIVWNVGDQVVNGSETGTSFKQALFFKDECGLNLHDTMIWQKPNFSNPSSTRYHQVFEYVFILSKGKPKTFNPIKDRKNIYAGCKGSFGQNTVTQQDGSKKIRASKIVEEYGMRHNVWVSKTAGQDGSSKKYKHPAMFTEEFARDHIITWSNARDTVLDCFMGSGTTGSACITTKRNFIGIELDEGYFKIAENRIAEAKSKTVC